MTEEQSIERYHGITKFCKENNQFVWCEFKNSSSGSVVTLVNDKYYQHIQFNTDVNGVGSGYIPVPQYGKHDVDRMMVDKMKKSAKPVSSFRMTTINFSRALETVEHTQKRKYEQALFNEQYAKSEWHYAINKITGFINRLRNQVHMYKC
jgi:hypothetical protein